MNATHAIVVLLSCAFVLGALLRIAGVWRLPREARPRMRRTLALLALSAASCALLGWCLMPRPVVERVDTLIVLTEGAEQVRDSTGRDDGLRIRLPGAPADAQAQHMPDLATALRAHPQARVLRVIGHGLEARDREAVDQRMLSFQPAPLPAGFRALGRPMPVLAGHPLRIGGEASALPEGIVELRDPAGQVIARTPLAADGRFVLEAGTRAAGPVLFELRLRDGDRVIDRQRIPVQVLPQQAARIALLAGGPAPDVKYLRRWATDHGATLHSDVTLGGGMQVGDGALALQAGTLSKFDLLVVDDRRWEAMGEAGRAAVLSAARAGLGVLVRISGPLSGPARASLRAAGLTLSDASMAPTANLPAAPGQGRDAPPLARMPMRVSANEGKIWLRDARNEPLAAWSGIGRGRVAVWLPMDTFQLALAGEEDAFDALWSDAFAEVARATQRMPRLDDGAGFVHQRSTLCGLGQSASVIAPDHTRIALTPDPATPDCAAFWPTQAGWHAIETGTESRHWYVQDADASLPLRLSVRQAETAALVNPETRGARKSSASSTPRPSNAWLWLAWLIVTSGLWLLERSRWGRRAP